FQAEDGIRDFHVTGVQTCALPIFTAQLNASVQGCGQLIEPPGGVIPPGSRVIFVTSTDMCVAANPFTALGDTLYIIFQAAGNSQDRKSTRLNSSHVKISYAVFCLK